MDADRSSRYGAARANAIKFGGARQYGGGGRMRGSTIRPGVASEPRIRRGYFECRYGQLHVHNAIPPGGGFDEATALLLLHHGPMSGAAFHRVLGPLGRDRSVYAPDLPGCGESDPPPGRPSIADYAAAVGDFLDAMRLRQVDVAGYRSGALVAAELALTRPQAVRRLACVSVPIVSEAERAQLLSTSWPRPPAEDGSHLLDAWHHVRDGGRPRLPVDVLDRLVAEGLRNGSRAAWATQAALEYPARERLTQLKQPVLLVRAQDDYSSGTLHARAIVPAARFVELPEVGNEAFERAPQRLAQLISEFLRAG
jgi:pimeloyl-ACP methyl ester carboxylesterase